MATVVALGTDHACCARCTDRARYARDMADLMGLRDWAIEVAHEPCQIGQLAEVRFPDDRRELEIAFCENWDDLDPYEQRHAVVHELVHPHIRDVFSAVEDGAREAFGGMAYRVYIASVRRQVEKSVDAVAAMLSPHMPGPAE